MPHPSTILTRAFGALTLLLFALPAVAQPTETKLVALDAAANDRFGRAVAIDGDRAVVGASGNRPGAVYVYERAGRLWREADKLLTPFGDISLAFGTSVALDGDLIVVGTGGPAYVFGWREEEWLPLDKLVASDAASGDCFGCSLAIDGETILLGAYGDDDERGSAYVFVPDTEEVDTWIEQEKLTDPDGEAGDDLGISVALQGNQAIAGAPFDTVNEVPRGSASVFTLAGESWSFDEKLYSAGATTTIQFGRSVAIDGDTIAVGAPGDRPRFNLPASGTVYRYDATADDIRATQVRVWPSDGGGGDQFGFSVALAGELMLVGAFNDDAPESDRGSAYLFDLPDNLLNESLKLTASDGRADDWYGFSVGVSGERLIVGADRHDLDEVDNDDAGAAYIVNLPEPAGAVLMLAALAALTGMRRGGARRPA